MCDRGPSIQLINGRRFHLLDPRPEDIDIEVIADALSKLCRFTGHTRSFYSVAQHSVLVSDLVDPDYALDGLLHDASEAFIGDISTPLKRALGTVIVDIEEAIHAVIADVFDTTYPHPYQVKSADLTALATERRDLMPHDPIPWDRSLERRPDPVRVVPHEPRVARAAFMSRFTDLMLGRAIYG